MPTRKKNKAPRWMSHVLIAAGIYNIAWGAIAVLFPLQTFAFFGMDAPLYPQFWQCIGMIVGVYGIGYLAASLAPYRHWPIVLVGLLGKIFGPIGFAHALSTGAFPGVFGLNIIFNDLIWWVPFGLILFRAWKAALLESESGEVDFDMALVQATTQDDESLAVLSDRTEVFVLFVRHNGCTFCREALADLREKRPALEARGILPCVVHMVDENEAESFFKMYDLGDIPRVSDPDRTLYKAFGLRRGSMLALLGPKVWLRGLQAGVFQGHGVGGLAGDGLQMPGAFIIKNRMITHAYRHQSAADRPDFEKLPECPCEPVGA